MEPFALTYFLADKMFIVWPDIIFWWIYHFSGIFRLIERGGLQDGSCSLCQPGMRITTTASTTSGQTTRDGTELHKSGSSVWQQTPDHWTPWSIWLARAISTNKGVNFFLIFLHWHAKSLIYAFILTVYKEESMLTVKCEPIPEASKTQTSFNKPPGFFFYSLINCLCQMSMEHLCEM